MNAARPRLYPLIAVPGGPQPPSTPAEKAAWDAGMDGLPNPDPDDPRITECWWAAWEVRAELASERRQRAPCPSGRF